MAPHTGTNLTRLAIAIREACDRRGWLQEDLIRESGIGRSTIQRLWRDDNTVVPGRRTKRDLERVFEWPARAVDDILAGGTPSLQPSEHAPPLGINPKDWERLHPLDREAIRAVVEASKRRTEAQGHPNERSRRAAG